MSGYWRACCTWLAQCCAVGGAEAEADAVVLGTGSFGRVVREWRACGGAVAVKHVAYGTPSQRARARSEAGLLRALDHPNVVRLLAYEECTARREARLVLELGGPSLTHVLLLDAAWDRTRARGAFAQLARAVAYLHARRVVHRDLKPDNLLLDAHGALKVVDFGLSHAFEACAYGVLYDAVGSVGYRPPELFFTASAAHDAYLADVWAMGVVLYAMLERHSPFECAAQTDARYAETAARQSLHMRPSLSLGVVWSLLESVVVDGTLAVDVCARRDAAWVEASVYVAMAR